jgi:prepilin-type N-terminal cleavage/methylation domain-containing protein
MPIETDSPVMANSWNLISRRWRRRIAVRGFPLIELLIVIASISILAAVAIPQVFAYRAKAVDAAMNSDLKNAALAMESYYALYRFYPSSIAVLTASGYVSSPGVGVTITILTPTSYTVTALASGGTQASLP